MHQIDSKGVQSDSSNIANACEEWQDLLLNEDLNMHKELIVQRCNQALTPYHYLANILHPKYRGRKLSGDKEEMAKEHLLDSRPELLPALCQFQTGDSQVPNSLNSPVCIDQMHPVA